MKSLKAEQQGSAAIPELVAAAEQSMPQQANALSRARRSCRCLLPCVGSC